MPALVDPVAFTYRGTRFVVSRSGAPAEVLASAEQSSPSPERATMLELDAAMADWVEGPARRCLSTQQAQDYARATLDRPHLAGWATRVSTPPTAPAAASCAGLTVGADEHRVDVEVGARAPGQLPSDIVARTVHTTAAGLEKQIATQCLTLAEADAVARRLVADQGSVSRVRDDTASCTRVDMEVGGSITVTLHGPATAQP